ncbi:uncharacterized protein BDW43DRAFT_304952 [Aspergillus alliaceus]|uniref:uncharacterized protein n=1 Tax=Petromyces alliaceus TaxID=209559 RepID=UPI0012A5436E|nr:uncharacterized protein BDW43DRAFT_304952 [Aspergillus alliaceus]KAB8226982.1 hypothetical protein BDW43DRAFT_304952 [Aspergillus alliaceus]
MTSGAPARGTELNQILFQNSAVGLRYLFLNLRHQQFLIRLAYLKTFSQTGQVREAIRALPETVSWLLLIYLMYIKPFLEFLIIQLNHSLSRKLEISVRPIDSWTLSTTMKTLMVTKLGQPLGVSTWRHLAQAIIRHRMQEQVPEKGPRNDRDNEGLGAQQMYHSRRTGQQIYSCQQVQFGQVRPDHQEALIQFSQYWHAYLGSLPLAEPVIQFYWPRAMAAQAPRHHVTLVTLPQAILNRLLKEFMQDEQATFRSPAQARALHALLTKVPYLILILLTAGGKTTLFLLGASLTISQTTILVAPLVALKMDLYCKAQALGLSVRIYEDSYDQGSLLRILLVLIESLAMPRFYSYTRTLAAQVLPSGDVSGQAGHAVASPHSLQLSHPTEAS